MRRPSAAFTDLPWIGSLQPRQICFDEVPGRFADVGLEEKPCSVGGDAMGVDVADTADMELGERCGRKPGTMGDSGRSSS